MSSENPSFGKQHAELYDRQWKNLAPLTQALYLLIKSSLRELSPEAQILCVGAGTGNELIALAQENPGWRFLALDTSDAMLEVCAAKIAEQGMTSRVEFHHGAIESLPHQEKYDAATCLLVSQFLTDPLKRRDFFKTIRNHLKPEGYLIHADLMSPLEENTYQTQIELWHRMLIHGGVAAELVKNSTSQWGQRVAISKRQEIEEILSAAGFKNITMIFQALFIHAWISNAS